MIFKSLFLIKKDRVLICILDFFKLFCRLHPAENFSSEIWPSNKFWVFSLLLYVSSSSQFFTFTFTNSKFLPSWSINLQWVFCLLKTIFDLFFQGTATPTHYLVLHNSGEMTPDQVSDLSNTKLLIAELVFLLREILLR
jgi:hypothetical protein